MKRPQKRKLLENEESQEAEEKGTRSSMSQEDASQSGSTGVAKAWSTGVEEVSSASEYFSCISSPSKLVHSSKGIQRLQQDSRQPRSPLAHFQERGETLAPSQHASFSSPSSYKTCVSSLHMNKEEKGMKIYYMRVQTQKGVAVSWRTEETSEPLAKKPRMEEMTIETVRAGTPPSDVSTRDLPSDSEPSEEEKEHEEKVESDSPPGSPTVEERPRAKTPDCLVTMENGFRCMACCRVFATMELLQEHVQYGIREGFSCHVFHLTMARLISKVGSESTQKEEDGDNEQEEEKQEEKKSEQQQPTEEDPSSNGSWSQCPAVGFILRRTGSAWGLGC